MCQSGADWQRNWPEGLLQARDPGVKHSPHWLCRNQAVADTGTWLTVLNPTFNKRAQRQTARTDYMPR